LDRFSTNYCYHAIVHSSWKEGIIVDTLRQIHIDRYIEDIRTAIGGVKDRVPSAELYTLCRGKKYAELVRCIRDQMCLERFPMRVNVDHIPSGFSAFIERDRLSLYTDPDHLLKAANIRLTLSRDMVRTSHADVVIFAIAHELSHILLEALGSGLARFEMAIDVTAMMAGYAEYYRDGKISLSASSHLSAEWFLPLDDIVRVCDYFRRPPGAAQMTQDVGYLTQEEVLYVMGCIENLRRFL